MNRHLTSSGNGPVHGVAYAMPFVGAQCSIGLTCYMLPGPVHAALGNNKEKQLPSFRTVALILVLLSIVLAVGVSATDKKTPSDPYAMDYLSQREVRC